MRETPRARNLVRTQAVDALSLEINLAGSRLVNAGQQIENRGLAGAVRSDQSVDLALLTAMSSSLTAHSPPKRIVALSVLQHGRLSSPLCAHRGFSPPSEVSLCVAELDALPLGGLFRLSRFCLRLRQPLNAAVVPNNPCGRVIIRMISSSE